MVLAARPKCSVGPRTSHSKREDPSSSLGDRTANGLPAMIDCPKSRTQRPGVNNGPTHR